MDGASSGAFVLRSPEPGKSMTHPANLAIVSLLPFLHRNCHRALQDAVGATGANGIRLEQRSGIVGRPAQRQERSRRKAGRTIQAKAGAVGHHQAGFAEVADRWLTSTASCQGHEFNRAGKHFCICHSERALAHEESFFTCAACSASVTYPTAPRPSRSTCIIFLLRARSSAG